MTRTIPTLSRLLGLPFALRFAPRRSAAGGGRALLCGSALLVCLALTETASAQRGGPPPLPENKSEYSEELQTLGAVIQGQLQAPQYSKNDFIEHLQKLEALRRKTAADNKVELVQICHLQSQILLSVFEDHDRAIAALDEADTLVSDGPQALVSKAMRGMALRHKEADAVARALIGRPAPPLRFNWSSRKGLTSLDQIKDKVVVIDFWSANDFRSLAFLATVRRLQERFAGLDVEIIGVTNLQGVIRNARGETVDFRGKPEKEMRQMAAYMKAQEITWTVVFADGPSYAMPYGFNGYPCMAIVAPDGTVRHTAIGPDSAYLTRAEMIDKILKEFGRETSGLVR